MSESRALLARLNAEMTAALARREVRERIEKSGMQTSPQTLEIAALFLEREAEKWGRAVKAAGSSVD